MKAHLHNSLKKKGRKQSLNEQTSNRYTHTRSARWIVIPISTYSATLEDGPPNGVRDRNHMRLLDANVHIKIIDCQLHTCKQDDD